MRFLALLVLLLATPALAQSIGVGDAVSVEWRGRWYPAHVLSVNGPGAWFITYDGYDHSWDETVGPSRIRLVASAAQRAPQPQPSQSSPGANDPVSVEWKGRWYPAHVHAVRAPNEWLIHYDGYDHSWDETVGPNRLRAVAKSAAQVAPPPPPGQPQQQQQQQVQAQTAAGEGVLDYCRTYIANGPKQGPCESQCNFDWCVCGRQCYLDRAGGKGRGDIMVQCDVECSRKLGCANRCAQPPSTGRGSRAAQ